MICHWGRYRHRVGSIPNIISIPVQAVHTNSNKSPICSLFHTAVSISTTRSQCGCSFSSLSDLTRTDHWTYTIWRSHANSRWLAVNKVWGREPQTKPCFCTRCQGPVKKLKCDHLFASASSDSLREIYVEDFIWNYSHCRVKIIRIRDSKAPNKLCKLAKHNVLVLRTQPNYAGLDCTLYCILSKGLISVFFRSTGSFFVADWIHARLLKFLKVIH